MEKKKRERCEANVPQTSMHVRFQWMCVETGGELEQTTKKEKKKERARKKSWTGEVRFRVSAVFDNESRGMKYLNEKRCEKKKKENIILKRVHFTSKIRKKNKTRKIYAYST